MNLDGATGKNPGRPTVVTDLDVEGSANLSNSDIGKWSFELYEVKGKVYWNTPTCYSEKEAKEARKDVMDSLNF